MSIFVSVTASQAAAYVAGHLRLLLHLGDLNVVLPIAAAIGAWLLAARAWRMAFWWCLLFAFGVTLVGASKIVFMGWGGGVPALSFKSFSGHATGAMAVFPMLFYLVMQGTAPHLGKAGAGAGVLVGLTVASLLVAFGEHSAAEALAGCALGAMASLGSLHLAGRQRQALRLPDWSERPDRPAQPGHGPLPAQRKQPQQPQSAFGRRHNSLRLRRLRRWRQLRGVVIAALVFVALAWLMKSAHIGYWMIKAARAISGNHHLYPLSTD